MSTRTIWLGLAVSALVALTSAQAGKAAYLSLGTSNTSNATTTLTGSVAGPELKVQNANGSSASAFGLYGLLTATSPTASSTAVRGHNSSTNAYGIGVWGSQAGSGTGVYGYTPSGRGVYGLTSSGIGVRGQSASGTGVYGLHSSSSGTAAGVRGDTSSTASNAYGVYGLLSSTSPGVNSAAVRGQSNGTGANGIGIGVWGSQAGSGWGVYGTSASGTGVVGQGKGGGVYGNSSDNNGVVGRSFTSAASGVFGENTSGGAGVFGSSNVRGVYGQSSSGYGVYGYSASSNGVRGYSANSDGVFGFSPVHNGVAGSSTSSADSGVYGENNSGGYGVAGRASGSGTAVFGDNPNGTGQGYGGYFATSGSGSGVYGQSGSGFGVSGNSSSGVGGAGVYGSSSSGDGVSGSSSSGYGVYGSSSSGDAGVFSGNVYISGTCTGCAGASLRIDDPLNPAHKYLQQSAVVSPQMKDVYDGIATTNGRGFATVRMPRYFQALNRSFRYQLTIVGTRGWNARVVKPIVHNEFTIQSDQPKVKVSWQVTGIRHDRYANAHRIQVVVPKPKAEQGKYLHPELYGEPKSDAIGYQKPPAVPRRTLHPR